ncbi:MAG: transaldolase family protein [Candidatus Nanopelagicales bacterium]
MTVSPFLDMTENLPSVLWNDSADLAELATSIQWGAVGATCNPVIAMTTLKAHSEVWAENIREYRAAHPLATEDAIGWAMVKKLSVDAAKLLEPAFEKYGGRNGRLSIQTDPRNYRDAAKLADQAVEFSRLAKNIIVKIPVTAAGVVAIEEATYRGVSINATVSFSVAQAIAVAEAVERGLGRREAAGLAVGDMGPVCTIMVGRTDDWLRTVVERNGVDVDASVCDWAGVAAFKKAYALYRERGYRTRLLVAAFRNHLHWSETMGGDVVISPPFAWQEKANASGIEAADRIHTPIDPAILEALHRIGPEFDKAYNEDGMLPMEFDSYGATVRTLRQFLQATADLEAFVRDVTLPNPDA